MPEAWYYANGGNRIGPLSKEALIEALSFAPEPEKILVWRAGFSDWRKTSELPELFVYVAKPPPLSRAPPILTPRLDDEASQLHSSNDGMSIGRALFSFRGRLNRTQYALIFFLGYLVPVIVTGALADTLTGDYAYIAVVLFVLAIWILLASVAKRFHDLNKPASHLLVFLVPVIGLIWALALLFIPGTSEANEYGPPP
jgi:uncharacterized membrane protein YhaH (DUF805 family)